MVGPFRAHMLYTVLLGSGQRDAHIGMNGAGGVTNRTRGGTNGTSSVRADGVFGKGWLEFVSAVERRTGRPGKG